VVTSSIAVFFYFGATQEIGISQAAVPSLNFRARQLDIDETRLIDSKTLFCILMTF
jgi:hypothetical protein